MSIRIKLTIIMLAIGLIPTALVGVVAYTAASSELQPLLGTIVVLSVILIVFSLIFTRLLTEPILRLVRVSRQFGQGDFTGRVPAGGHDELGQLGDSLNTMGISLQQYVARMESQRNRLEIILNSSADSILAINKAGIIILANAATTALTRVKDVVGQPVTAVFTWKQEIQRVVIDYTKEGTNTYPNLQFIDAAGEIHYVKLIVAKLDGEQDAEAPQTIVTIHDETKSRDLDKMKVDFVSMAAHELRTPLAATRGYLELVSYKESNRMLAESKNYLQQALKSTAELGGLIDNLLGVTRIERGTLTLHPDRLDVAVDLQQAINNASFTASDKRIALAYDGPASGCFAIADQMSLHEVFNNLINNAIKYTHAGGSVTVTIARSGNDWMMQFRDTGIGIPKRALPNLFTKFYRVHGGLNSGSTGTGLGLFISKSIIERHGGTISVESEEGKGATFTVKIPVFNEQRYAELQLQQDRTSQVTTRGSRGWTTKNITR